MSAGIRLLLPLPNVDALLLTAAELANLTGTRQLRLQIKWLMSNGWMFFRTRSTQPALGRLYANLRLTNFEF